MKGSPPYVRDPRKKVIELQSKFGSLVGTPLQSERQLKSYARANPGDHLFVDSLGGHSMGHDLQVFLVGEDIVIVDPNVRVRMKGVFTEEGFIWYDEKEEIISKPMKISIPSGY